MLSGTTVKAVLFDFDDTLAQTKPTKYQAIIEMGRRFYGLSLTESHIDKYWGMPHVKFYQELFGKTETDLEALFHNRAALSLEFPNMAYPDAEATLIYLTQRYKVGIVTASGREIVEDELKTMNFPLRDLLFVQTSEDTPYHKPDPRVFEPALARLARYGIVPGEVLYVGDALRDYQAAYNAGMHFMGMADRTTPARLFEQENVPYVFSLTELKQLL